jgi:hypothetical protein
MLYIDDPRELDHLLSESDVFRPEEVASLAPELEVWAERLRSAGDPTVA